MDGIDQPSGSSTLSNKRMSLLQVLEMIETTKPDEYTPYFKRELENAYIEYLKFLQKESPDVVCEETTYFSVNNNTFIVAEKNMIIENVPKVRCSPIIIRADSTTYDEKDEEDDDEIENEYEEEGQENEEDEDETINYEEDQK